MRFLDVYTTPGAVLHLWKLCRERDTESETNISFKMPTWREHIRYVASRPYPYWYLIYGHGGKSHIDGFAGSVYLTNRNEIGINLLDIYRGKGLGIKALKYFISTHNPLSRQPGERAGTFLANINPHNRASIKLFEKAGFKLRQLTYEHTPTND
jgi:RimJ/RimL family protein N-acetyltransferase